jgi:hypothetical protein
MRKWNPGTQKVYVEQGSLFWKKYKSYADAVRGNKDEIRNSIGKCKNELLHAHSNNLHILTG